MQKHESKDGKQAVCRSYAILVDRETKHVWLLRPHDVPMEEDFWFLPSVKTSFDDTAAIRKLVETFAQDQIHVQGGEKLGEEFDVGYPGDIGNTAVVGHDKVFVMRIFTPRQAKFVCHNGEEEWQSFSLTEAVKRLNDSPYNEGLEYLKSDLLKKWL